MLWPALVEGTLRRRYQRFLADIELPNGEVITAHCPNTGKMTGCAEPGSRVWLLDSANPKRKLRYTWELVQTTVGDLACVHAARANALVEEALCRGVISDLAGFQHLRREVPLGDSRADFCLEYAGAPSCYIEVKSVTLALGDGIGAFPDAVSARASKHLRELMAVRARGDRAVLLFACLHSGIHQVRAAHEIDPTYATTLAEATARGVEVRVLHATIDTRAIALTHLGTYMPFRSAPI